MVREYPLSNTGNIAAGGNSERNLTWTHEGTSQYELENMQLQFVVGYSRTYKAYAYEIVDGRATQRLNTDFVYAGAGTTVTVALDRAAWANRTGGTMTFKFYAPSSGTNSYRNIKVILTYRAVAEPSTITVQTAIAGDPQTVSISNTDPDVYHTVRWQYPGSIDSGVQTFGAANRSPAWAVPETSLPALFLASPNSATVTGTVTVATYRGDGTLVGSTDYSAVLTLPENDTTRPAIVDAGTSVSAQHDSIAAAIYAVTGNAYVQAHSKLAYEVEAEGYQGAGIEYIRILTPDGILQLTNGEGEHWIRSAGNYPITVEVQDTRGFTRVYASKWTISNVQAYSPPAVTSLQAIRCDSNGQAAEDGTYVWVEATAACAAISSTLTLTAAVTEQGSSTVLYSGTLTNGTAILGGGLSENKSYEITVTATDAFGLDNEAVIGIGTGIMTITRMRGGKGVAFGMMANRMGVEVRKDWPVYMHGQEILRLIMDLAHPPGSSMEAAGDFDPNVLWPWTVWAKENGKWTRGV